MIKEVLQALTLKTCNVKKLFNVWEKSLYPIWSLFLNLLLGFQFIQFVCSPIKLVNRAPSSTWTSNAVHTNIQFVVLLNVVKRITAYCIKELILEFILLVIFLPQIIQKKWVPIYEKYMFKYILTNSGKYDDKINVGGKKIRIIYSISVYKIR